MAQSRGISDTAPSNTIGLVDTIGGFVTAGQPFTRSTPDGQSYICSKLHIGTGAPTENTGNLFVEDTDGNVIPYLGLGSDSWIFVKAKRVLSSVTIGGTTYNTTCTNITWHGGAI